MMQLRSVAAIGIDAMLSRRATVLPGLRNKLIVFSNRFTPRRVQALIMERVFGGKV